jgi:hypothetical protein
MNKMKKMKYPALFLGFIVALFITSCVDTSVQNIDVQDYRSQVRFVNDVPNEAASVSLDGSQVSSLQTGETSAYRETTSGSHDVVASYANGPSAEGRLVFETDSKITITVVEDTLGNRSFVKTVDGYIWQ